MSGGEREHLDDEAKRLLGGFESAAATESPVGDHDRAVESLTSAATSDWSLGEALLRQASCSDMLASRKWAAVLLSQADAVSRDGYLEVMARLLDDPDPDVRASAIESLMLYPPRKDLSWADVAPLLAGVI